MNRFIQFLKTWKNQKSYAIWLFRYSKSYMPKILFMMLCNLSVTVISIRMAVLSKNIIDRATSGAGFVSVLVAYGIFVVAMLSLDAIKNLLAITLDERFSFGIRKQIYEKIIHSYYMDVKKYHTGDLMTRLTSDAGNVSNGIIYTIPSIIQLVAELLIAFGTLFYYQPFLALFALVIGPICALVSLLLGRKLSYLQKKVQESEASYRSFLQESMANLLVVKSFANEDYMIEKLTDLRATRFKWVYKRGVLGIVSQALIGFSFNFAYIVAFSFGAVLISAGTITYGTMSLFLTLVNRVQSPVLQLAQQIPKVVSIFASASRIIELEDLAEEKMENGAEKLVNQSSLGIRTTDLSFGYLPTELVLENLSLEIEPGEFVAILGESGIGKTTLVHLMMSFMGQYQGGIGFYTQDGKTVKTDLSMRQFISYVPQGNTLFSGTIRENIRMGKIDATTEEMEEALKLAAAYDFVMNLPQGLDTRIGEQGHGISQGQAQRIAIARCLVRKAPFMILDEATSSLDSDTELTILASLRKLSPRPTCVIVTHRASVLEYCDRQIKLS